MVPYCLGLKQPLTAVVIDDFEETLKRISEVEFLPGKVLIKLIAGNHSVRFSILLLDMKVIGQTNDFPYVSGKFDLTKEWLEKFVTFDEEQLSLVIPIPGAQKLILSDSKNSVVFIRKDLK